MNISSRSFGIFFFILIIFEFLLFKTFVMREIAYFYPAGFDQTSYLMDTYHLYNQVISQGLITGLSHFRGAAEGLLFSVQAVLFFVLFGVSRLHALLINFIYFILLQLSCILVIRKFSTKIYVPLIFLGLLLLIHTPFKHIGGIADFRLDFIAFCLYGIFIAIVVRSHIFLNRKWSIIAALVAVLLILFRYITAAYVAPVLILMLLCALIDEYWVNGKTSKVKEKRSINILITGAIIFLCAVVPFLLLAGSRIYNYYVVGHVLGGEKNIRALEQGITNLWSSVVFYPKSILFDHFGWRAILGCVGLLGLSILAYIVTKILLPKKRSVSNELKSFPLFWNMLFLLLCIFIPVIVLMLDTTKTPIVGGIVVMPLLWLVMLIFVWLDNKRRIIIPTLDWLFFLMAVVIFAFGLCAMTHSWNKTSSIADRQQLAVISKMYVDIGNYATTHGQKNIYLSIDGIRDCVNSGSLTAVYFEQKHVLLNVTTLLAGSIFAISKEAALSDLYKSNVIILDVSNNRPKTGFPLNVSVATFWPVLQTYAKLHFDKLGDYSFKGSVFRVYVKFANNK